MEKICILLEDHADIKYCKTTIALIKYSKYDVVAIIDSKNKGKFSDDVLGTHKKIPFVSNIKEAFKINKKIKALFIGISPPGGEFPEIMRNHVKEALSMGLNVVSGLHYFLSEDPEFCELARLSGSKIIDIRKISKDKIYYNRYNPRRAGTNVILTVGSDCSVGKMITTIELNKSALNRGLKSTIAMTGHTGMMIVGDGIPVDATISDFTIGTISKYIQYLAENHDYVFVEGQGTITHGNISLALLHGAEPDYLVLCHQVGRKYIKGYNQWLIPPLNELVKIYEYASSWKKGTNYARVIGISLDTHLLSHEEAIIYINSVQKELNIVTTDPWRFGVKKIIDEIISKHKMKI
ncbi:hypothetical protein XO10_01395 [Marinitoga sp. 1135]|uniref:DUF1611 domain-containing protein n=1 Tax=unclassified Marinitoga TaxID=2640159 RepID=UPI0009509FAD|nr:MULTISPECIES: DUF1611 domain-containing protein [unclassified Marinitoga]APT75184.1 hypothetical protein LN42_01310 [Marinitoga sp. 1137]NUU94958.1 hypothetical protein [Marinitoga sp. 1135]NUU96927.1 hypothetical protein [Marinitoga sp. 1138]